MFHFDCSERSDAKKDSKIRYLFKPLIFRAESVM